ncbi:MAG: (2Fe-2S)-binding protein [Gammaproteobacteria bacterium]|nr:(2Fe-2S)-binding protein [Gammaproteobacteria bacterium]
MNQIIELNVNGQRREIMVAPRDVLVDVLRKSLGLTGSKIGCRHGHCGACTVLIDGKPSIACLTIAMSCQGKEITTIEGLDDDGKLDPLQHEFIERGAVQCGYCIPGMILTAKALLAVNPDPSEDEVREGLAGNLCRCTGYAKIIEAVQAAAQTDESR